VSRGNDEVLKSHSRLSQLMAVGSDAGMSGFVARSLAAFDENDSWGVSLKVGPVTNNQARTITLHLLLDGYINPHIAWCIT
jgi:hypothetical protein